MKIYNKTPRGVMLALTLLVLTDAASGVTFSALEGELTGTFDSTFSYGLSIRTEDPKLSRSDLNTYGNRNFGKWDVFSNVIRGSHDLGLKYKNVGAFVRGNYFYDAQMDREELFDDAQNRAVSHGDILDAFIYADLGDVRLRLGKQVVSWGESTFIGGGLNDVNTVDVSRTRQAGVELKDILWPTRAIRLEYQVTDAWSIDGFYLLGFDETKLDPSGSLFAVDSISDGGGGAVPFAGPPIVPFVAIPAANKTPDGISLTTVGPLARGPDNIPSYGGQFGFALRHYTTALFGGGELGLYFQNLHNHNPSIGALYGAGRFVVDYAKDIRRYGASFNTKIGPVAIGGEYSYRPNDVLQDSDFVPAGLGAFGPAFQPRGTLFKGYERYSRGQAQMTAQYIHGPLYMLRSQGWNLLVEGAYGHANFPSRFKAGFDESYWGYSARTDLSYPNLLFQRINVDPFLAVTHNVRGSSPNSVFVDERKQASVGVNFSYNVVWRASAAYTTWWDDSSSTDDKDFLAFSISREF